MSTFQIKMADEEFEPLEPTLQNILDAKSLRLVPFGREEGPYTYDPH